MHRNDEVVDLLAGGQGVFGIAVGGVWREIEGSLAELPSERTDEPWAEATGDELPSARARAPTANPRPRGHALVAATVRRGCGGVLTTLRGRVPGPRRPGRRRGDSPTQSLRLRTARAGI